VKLWSAGARSRFYDASRAAKRESGGVPPHSKNDRTRAVAIEVGQVLSS
jgi:hypothetical protein